MLKHKWWKQWHEGKYYSSLQNTTAVYTFVLITNIYPEFSRERYVKLEADVAQWRMMDKDLAEFLFSKLEFKVYYFLFFANRAREKLWLTCPSIKIIGKLKKTQWAFLVLLVLVAHIVISHIHKAQSR